MISKLACFLAAALATVSSVNGNGHAYSSQHVSKHDGHAHVVYIPSHGHGHNNHYIDYNAYPKYEYKYRVNDPHTGDYKSHHEERDGDVVKGYYELKEPDGSIRRVEYHADKHTGFHATVKYSTHHVIPKHHHHQTNHQQNHHQTHYHQHYYDEDDDQLTPRPIRKPYNNFLSHQHHHHEDDDPFSPKPIIITY